MNTKTSKKQFKLFKETCEEWINKLGLHGWHVIYEHIDIKDANANIYYDIYSRVAKINLAKDFYISEVSDNIVKLVAFHEVCELLLGRINTLAFERKTTEDDLIEETHNIIRILEKFLYKE